jgi:FKBP-type peptidyl-prolyl cis-trans isomerase FkpA
MHLSGFYKYKFVLSLIVLFLFVSCKKKMTQAEMDEKIISKYISDHGLNATATGSGLYYLISTEGNGANPGLSSTVVVKYKGTLTDGTVFDQSTGTGATLLLSNTIQGWQEGMPYFKKGGKGTLLIPSALGYGNSAVGKIPAASVLIFDIELVDVK